MGNSHGKPEGEFSGDTLFMFKQDSDSVKYLKKWKTKYGFSGELNVFEIETICKNLKTIAVENKKPRLSASQHHELEQAEQWFQAAKERAQAQVKEKLRAVGNTRGKKSSQALYTKNDFGLTAYQGRENTRGGYRRGRGRGRGQTRGRGKERNEEECWTCGEVGHWSHDCPNPKWERKRPQ